MIISSQYLYFFQESPPDPSTLHKRINLDDLAECRAALGKTSRLREEGERGRVGEGGREGGRERL